MHTLRAFFGVGVLRVTLAFSLGIVVIAFAAMLSPAFREKFTQVRRRSDWPGALAGVLCGVFKFLLVFITARLLITALVFQAGLFERQHGRVTERNRSAVLMKWGYPHGQKEMSVSHTRKRVWVTRRLYVKGQPEYCDYFWKDEEKEPLRKEGKRPKIVGTTEEERYVPVPQKSIVAADIDIALKSVPRKLGNANYAGYEDRWNLKYTVANRSEFETKAHMSFPLPAKTGLFDDMCLRVNGTNLLQKAAVQDSRLTWSVGMPARGTNVVEVGYQSRGLEYLRYVPRRMTQTGHYRVSMSVNGIPPDKLDYPIGAMPPKEDIDRLGPSPYTLTWKLDNALTSYDIGIKLPEAEQPEYYFARLLRESPAGLIFLVLLLGLSRIMLRQPVRPELIAILGAAYGMHYTFMARLADLLPGFVWPFAISAGVMTAIVTWFRLRDREWRPIRILDCAIFLVIVALYPLAITDSDSASLWMQLLHMAALVHVCVLLVSRRAMAAPVDRRGLT
ncbi:hypothetical protein ACFLQU_04640 [Verrucomicrobiota bacterium]